jgi:hypothetical protein
MLHFAPVSITHVAGLDNNKPEIASQAITHLDVDHAIASHALPSCAGTETGRDILQALIDAKVQLPPCQSDSFMTSDALARRPILAAVESPDRTTLDRVERAALHTIHGLFPPPEQLGNAGAKILFPF